MSNYNTPTMTVTEAIEMINAATNSPFGAHSYTPQQVIDILKRISTGETGIKEITVDDIAELIDSVTDAVRGNLNGADQMSMVDTNSIEGTFSNYGVEITNAEVDIDNIIDVANDGIDDIIEDWAKEIRERNSK